VFPAQPKLLCAKFAKFVDCVWFQIVQKEREDKLAQILKDRLNEYVINKDEFISNAEAEVARLSNAGNILCRVLPVL